MGETHRRLVRLLSIACCVAGLLAATAPAQAANTETLITSAKLIKQPKGQPWWIGLTLGATIGTTDGSKPSALSKAVFLFPRAAMNARQFPTCSLKKIKTKSASCPRGSKLGTGTSLLDASPLLNPAHADVTVFNAPARHGNPVLVFHSVGKEVQTTIDLQGTLTRVHGRFGYKLVTNFPHIPTLSGYPDASITQFQVTTQAITRRHGRQISLLESPTSCPSSGWQFEGDFSFFDGQSGVARAAIGCTLSGKPI